MIKFDEERLTRAKLIVLQSDVYREEALEVVNLIDEMQAEFEKLKSELEQREREAFEAARESHIIDNHAWDYKHFPQLKFKSADDYLKQRKNDQEK